MRDRRKSEGDRREDLQAVEGAVEGDEGAVHRDDQRGSRAIQEGDGEGGGEKKVHPGPPETDA